MRTPAVTDLAPARERFFRRLVELWHQEARAVRLRIVQAKLWYHWQQVDRLKEEIRNG